MSNDRNFLNGFNNYRQGATQVPDQVTLSHEAALIAKVTGPIFENALAEGPGGDNGNLSTLKRLFQGIEKNKQIFRP